jgi:hypothetical protein
MPCPDGRPPRPCNNISIRRPQRSGRRQDLRPGCEDHLNRHDAIPQPRRHIAAGFATLACPRQSGQSSHMQIVPPGASVDGHKGPASAVLNDGYLRTHTLT